MLGTVLEEAPQAAPGRKAEDLVRVRMLADTDIIAAGQTFHVAVVFDIAPHWHIYWKNPGDSGAATELTWRAPGNEIGPVQWPAPQVFREAEGLLTTFGYEEEARSNRSRIADGARRMPEMDCAGTEGPRPAARQRD